MLFLEEGPEFRPKLLLSDDGKEFKNQKVNFVCKSNEVFQIFSLPYSPLGIIERFGQTIKRKLRKGISKGSITKQNFVHKLMRVLKEYNQTVHSTTKQRPVVVHFVHKPAKWRNQVLTSVKRRIQQIKETQMTKARLSTIPLRKGQEVRVLVWKDPRLSRGERHNIKKKFTYKKFTHSYWTRSVFRIEKVVLHNYKLEGFSQNWFVREDLQRVSKFL